MTTLLTRLYNRTPPRRLQDLNHLISYLHALINDDFDTDASHFYYHPPADSELGRECQEAFRVLQKLENDEDFIADIARQAKADEWPLGNDFLYDFLSFQLSSTKNPTPNPAEVFTIAGHSVTLRNISIYWAMDVNVLLDIHRKIGNGLKSDGSVRLDQVLDYYALIPPRPGTNADWRRLLHNLIDQRALWFLGYNGHVSDLQHLLGAQGDNTILEVIRKIEGETSRSLWASIVPAKFNAKLERFASTTPVALLETILQTRKNLQLAQRIATELDWYGARGQQTCPTSVLTKLLWRALWLSVKPDPHSIHPNELRILIESGSRYSSIRDALTEHFQRSLGVDRPVALLAMAVMKSSIASEVWVQDIPEELLYGTSSTWVSFKSGFILAESIAPGSSRYMTFEQLLNLPAEHYRAFAGNIEQQRLAVAAKVRPTIDWAAEMGLFAIRQNSYPSSETELALKTLDRHEQEMISATATLALKPPSHFRYESDAAFEEAFQTWLSTQRAAYKTLIKALLAQILPTCQGDLEADEVTVYSLRLPLNDTQVEHENKQNTDAVRARSGFILRLVSAHYPFRTRYVEVFPRAGVGRVRKDIESLPVGGEIKVEKVGSSTRTSRGAFRKGTALPFDWEAYRDGFAPRENQQAILIVEQLGDRFDAVPIEQRSPDVAKRTLPFAANNLTSARAEELATMIARELFFKDESALLEQTRKATRNMDIGRDFAEDMSFWGKMFVPFWGSIDDLVSGDLQRVESGGLGLFTDLVSFALPIGKYLSGCTRLVSNAGRAGLRLAMPRLLAMTRTLAISMLQELNPLEAAIAALRFGRFGLRKLGSAALHQARRGIAHLNDGTIAARHLTSVDPTNWVPRQPGDRLCTVEGIVNIPMRNIGSGHVPDFRLIDSVSNQAFGPAYRQPITVISNNSPLIRQYAVDPHWIDGLKADARGIFFRPEHNQKFICNVDEHGTIAVYQIRENSYGFIMETAMTGENSFSVVLVNPRNNRDLSINLSSVKPGHWYTNEIRMKGGAPGDPAEVTPLILTQWSQVSERALGRALKAFAKKHRLDPIALQQFVHTRGQFTPLGQQVLDQAETARTAVTYENLQNWRAMPQQDRNSLTREGFAAQHNLDPVDFIDHVHADGSFKARGKVLEKYANNQTFTPLTPEHLKLWRTSFNLTRSASSMDTFIDENNLDPLLWATFVNERGELRSAVTECLQLIEASESEVMLARKSLPPGTAIKSVPAQPLEAPEPHSTTSSAQPTAGSSKRARMDDAAAATASAADLTPSLGHKINNNAPILQDPADIRISLTRKLEGAVDKVTITQHNQFFSNLTETRRQSLTRSMTEDIREWIIEEGRHHDRLSERFELRRPLDGPERGLSVFAKVDIEPYEVLGPYSGKLHRTVKSLHAEILEKSNDQVRTFLYETKTRNATLSGHGNSNILSMINAAEVPGQPRAGIENVGSIYVGKYMVFLVAWEKIPKGTELLLDYGPDYWQALTP
ncbi:SET domain-containing protein [Pseudomonas moraviensis subsp. stanleyae]|uniref:SET domain-containing protein n=1 Tax=Pseudomonas moraviensis TaxID=321662 RepID=UPI002E37D78F|nr:SET domain-containing protein [Pseudomonas moraviensis]MED7666157.1 SET domain-containing protein [Pseudomonas moraviensis subsp. stanleyae]